MNCVDPPTDIKVQKETIVKQENELDDPFDNSFDDSRCNYDSDPFRVDSDKNQSTSFKQTSSKNKVSQKTPVLIDKVGRRNLPRGTLDKHFTVLSSSEFSCKHCDFVTNRRANICQHTRTRHLNLGKIYQCPYCPFQSKFRMDKHIIARHKTDSEIKWYKCHQCSYKAKLKPGFIRHLETHKTVEEKMGNMMKCDQCPKMFDRKALRQHKNIVHDKDKLQLVRCYLCDYNSYFKHNLKVHIDRVHVLGKMANDENLKTLSCGKCKYKTKFEYCLKNHSQKHSKIILCEKCPYRTHSNEHLKLHVISHQKVKNEKDLKYKCDKCDYKTYRLYSFQVHKLKHLKPEEIQYFYCYHCEFKAKRKDNLKTHIKNHFKNNELVCYICDFKTNTKISHIAHMGKHSKEQKIEQSILNGNPSGKQGKRKRQSSFNNTKKDPLKRRKGQNDEDELENLEINESVRNVNCITRLGKHSKEQKKEQSILDEDPNDRKKNESVKILLRKTKLGSTVTTGLEKTEPVPLESSNVNEKKEGRTMTRRNRSKSKVLVQN